MHNLHSHNSFFPLVFFVCSIFEWLVSNGRFFSWFSFWTKWFNEIPMFYVEYLLFFFIFLFLYNTHSFTINFESMKIYQFDFSLNSSSVRKNLKHNVISHTTFLAFLLFFPFSQGSTFFVSACLLDCLCGTALPSVCAMNARRKYVLNYTWFFWFGRTSMDCIVWQM